MSIRWWDCLLVAIGSALGGTARFVLASWIAARFPTILPWGIFAVNSSGCFLIGLLMGFITKQPPLANENLRLLLGVGFLGGYTTFSTLLYDSWRLGIWWGMANLIGSGIAGCLAAGLGILLSRIFQ